MQMQKIIEGDLVIAEVERVESSEHVRVKVEPRDQIEATVTPPDPVETEDVVEVASPHGKEDGDRSKSVEQETVEDSVVLDTLDKGKTVLQDNNQIELVQNTLDKGKLFCKKQFRLGQFRLWRPWVLKSRALGLIRLKGKQLGTVCRLWRKSRKGYANRLRKFLSPLLEQIIRIANESSLLEL